MNYKCMLVICPVLLLLLGISEIGATDTGSFISEHIKSITLNYSVVDDDITAQITLEYWEDTQDSLWVIPVPEDVTFQMKADWRDEDLYESYVMPDMLALLHLPPRYCGNLYATRFSDHSGGGYLDYYGIALSEIIDIRLASSDEMTDQLQASDYAISDEIMSALSSYATQGFSFIIVEIADDEGAADNSVGTLQLQLNYSADSILLPLQHLLADASPFPLYINIMAETRYIATNYAEAQFDTSQFRVNHALTNYLSDGAALAYFTDRSNFASVRDDAVRNSSSLYTYIAAPTEILIAEMYDNSRYQGYYLQDGGFQDKIAIEKTIGAHDYLTQMYSILSSDAAVPDPIFQADHNAPAVSNIIDVTDQDPLTVWGCSTRTISGAEAFYAEVAPHLPVGRTQVSSSRLPLTILAHPPDWQLSEFQYQGAWMSVFAPSSVDETTLDRYIAGEDTEPMLLIQHTEVYAPSPCFQPYGFLDLPESAIPPRYFHCSQNVSAGGLVSSDSMIGVLTSADDFAENEAMYRAMVDYPFTYQYRLHQRLRHTLVLSATNNQEYAPGIYVLVPPLVLPYPEGWQEQTIGKQDILIMPETSVSMENAPYVRVYPVSSQFDAANWDNAANHEARKEAVIQWLVAQFGVDYSDSLEVYLSRCDLSTPIVPFENEHRSGFVSYIMLSNATDNPFILEISAPNDLYAAYHRDIVAMAEAARLLTGCG